MILLIGILIYGVDKMTDYSLFDYICLAVVFAFLYLFISSIIGCIILVIKELSECIIHSSSHTTLIMKGIWTVIKWILIFVAVAILAGMLMNGMDVLSSMIESW